MPVCKESELEPRLLEHPLSKPTVKSLGAVDCIPTPASCGLVTLPRTAVLKLRAQPSGSARRAPGGLSDCGRELSLAKLQSVYEHPISTAAAQLNIGVTVLKKYCRWYSIDRWPYRKIRSVDKLIEQLGQLDDKEIVLEVRQELQDLRQQLLCNPALDLDERVKRLRQATFKYQYKQRHQPQ